MRLGLILGFILALTGYAAAQDADAPNPLPRPEHFGSAPPTVDPDEEGFDDPDGPDFSHIVIDGESFGEDPSLGPNLVSTMDSQPVTLSARIGDDGAFIPDGLVWRVFDTRTDATGELALLAKSEEATAALSLPPGDYLLHVAFGRAQVSDTLRVEPGPNTKTVILEAGALQLSAAVTGDIAIPANLLSFDISANGEPGRTLVAENVTPGETIHLNAGIYSVTSYFGAINAVVRADLRVEPGQITEATLYHRAAQLSFKLVSETGGEAIADVEWTVKSAGGETIFTDIGAFPATVLAEGDYLVLAKQGETVYNREFEVQAGAPREIEVLTAVY